MVLLTTTGKVVTKGVTKGITIKGVTKGIKTVKVIINEVTTKAEMGVVLQTLKVMTQ